MSNGGGPPGGELSCFTASVIKMLALDEEVCAYGVLEVLVMTHYQKPPARPNYLKVKNAS